MAPVIRHLEPGYDALLRLRFLGLAAFLATGLGIVLLVERTWGFAEACAAGLFILANTMLFDLGSLLYLDTFAAPLVAFAALSLVGERLRTRNVALAAVAVGLAGLFTQKAAMAVPGLVYALAAGIRRERAQGRNPWPAVVAGVLAGSAVCAALLWHLLGRAGLAGFWESAVLLNLRWKARHFPYSEFSDLLVFDTFATGLAAWGLVLAARDGWRRRFRPESSGVPAACFVSLLLGIFILPVVWEEYFVLLVPFLCAVAGVTLVRAVRAERAFSFEGLGALVGIGALGLRMSWRLIGVGKSVDPITVTLVAIAWLLLAADLALRSRRGRPPRWAVLFLPALVYSVVVQVGTVNRHGNDTQRARIEYVMKETRPDEPYFDGYSGYGVFRPHAYRYWFLHEEVQPMLGREELTQGTVEALETIKPRLVTVDHWTRMLPSEVLGELEARYRATEFPDIWKRREAN